MKKYLVHTHAVSGHHLEYLHHLYMGAIKRPNDSFCFVVPSGFIRESDKFEWPKANNIVVKIMKAPEEEPAKGSLLKKSYVNARTINRYCRFFNATEVITLSVMAYLPFLPLFVRRIRFSSIVYRIYLYEWREESFLKKAQDVIKYLIMSKFGIFNKVFICNDSVSAHYFNILYKVDKFHYLPDPVSSLANYKGRDLREQLGIMANKKVFLHPGSMDSYKNTLGILKSLLMFNREDSEKMVVIFAGRVVPGIRKEFDRLFEEVKKTINLVFIEGYIPFEQLADMFVTCDYVLVPYTVKCQSSGVIGHAAYYGKPVIAVQGGVIGNIVREWNLGCLLKDPSESSIYQCIKSILNKPSYSTEGNRYLETHTIDAFTNTLIGD